MDVLYAVAEKLYVFMETGPSLLVALPLFAVVGVPLVFVHEIGHAIAARAMLGADVEVKVGTAGRLADLQLGRIKVELNAALPLAGRGGHAAFDAARARALDILVIALAGPLASLLGTILTALLLARTGAGSVAHDVLWAATGFGAAACIINLIPMEVEESVGRWRTDGRLALDAARALRERAGVA